jgi:hypothetical protein
MIRVRGHIGDWPVDLTLELDEADWARLHLSREPEAPAAAAASVAGVPPEQDRHWEAAQALLRHAGSLEGPQLLEQLQALAGSTAAAKRLMVRLRHSPQVQLDGVNEVPRWRWVD